MKIVGASNENKFVLLPVRTVFKYSFFSRTITEYRLELPPTGCSSFAVDSVLARGSAELDILQPLLIINLSWHSGGNGWSASIAGHIAPKNRKTKTEDHVTTKCIKLLTLGSMSTITWLYFFPATVRMWNFHMRTVAGKKCSTSISDPFSFTSVLLRPVYSDTTQLNSTSSCVGKVSIATRRRNSTRRWVASL